MKLSIVCYLDEKSTHIVRDVQEKLSELTGAKASLDLWRPHITIGDGVNVNEDELVVLQDNLNNLAANTTFFHLDMYDILKIDFRKGGEGEVSTPYGLYLDVKSNDGLLNLVSRISKMSSVLNK